MIGSGFSSYFFDNIAGDIGSGVEVDSANRRISEGPQLFQYGRAIERDSVHDLPEFFIREVEVKDTGVMMRTFKKFSVFPTMEIADDLRRKFEAQPLHEFLEVVFVKSMSRISPCTIERTSRGEGKSYKTVLVVKRSFVNAADRPLARAFKSATYTLTTGNRYGEILETLSFAKDDTTFTRCVYFPRPVPL